MRGRLHRWLTRPSRIPRPLRAGAALVLTTTALFGILAPHSSGETKVRTPGPLTAAGGPPDTSANAPSKAPEPPGKGSLVTTFPTSQALRSEGEQIYDNGCSACHGLALDGRHNIAPSLVGVGAGPIDFYVSTGRMPMQNPRQQPEAAVPAYDAQQTDALIAYIVGRAGGPAAPAVQVRRGDLSQGFALFTLHCAGCHQIVARGGMTVGAYAPNLQSVTPRQIAEAVRMGPYLMPHFDAQEINQEQLNSLARYVEQTSHPENKGGWGIYNIGPAPEGMAAWFIALLAMVIVARLIGERTGKETS